MNDFLCFRYTGHCPTLRFHYGKSYGAKTKEILQVHTCTTCISNTYNYVIFKELREKQMLYPSSEIHRENHYINNSILKPLHNFNKYKIQTPPAINKDEQFPKYISGYTGFVPTLNFRYGKTYSKAANDSIFQFSIKQRHQKDLISQSKTTPLKITPIRRKHDIKRMLKQCDEVMCFKEKEISPENPPITGYTGHIPRIKGSEESLSQRYDTVVKRGLKLLSEEREKGQ